MFFSLISSVLWLGCTADVDETPSVATLEDWSGWLPADDAPRRAMVIGIDGLKPDAVAVADTPWLDLLGTQGAYTDAATTQLTTATVSGPGWASILTGVEPTANGIT